jgi:hypothetical protein
MLSWHVTEIALVADTGTALEAMADCEQLLTASVDFGNAASPSGSQPTVAVPSCSIACLPEATDLPSPEELPVRKSDWNVLESREWRSIADDERPVTAPQVSPASRRRQQTLSSCVAADTQPFTSSFNVRAALTSVCSSSSCECFVCLYGLKPP